MCHLGGSGFEGQSIFKRLITISTMHLLAPLHVVHVLLRVRILSLLQGVVIKYSEPPEARVPKTRWRLYPFRGDQALRKCLKDAIITGASLSEAIFSAPLTWGIIHVHVHCMYSKQETHLWKPIEKLLKIETTLLKIISQAPTIRNQHSL